MESTIASVVDFPADVLSLILSNLEPKDYLRFIRVSKVIYNEFRQDSAYWRTQTANTFRLPISPLLTADGPRWYWLYKRLKTQTRLYTWGKGLRGNLGLGRSLSVPRRRTAAPGADQVTSRAFNEVPNIPFVSRLPFFRRPIAPRQTFQRTFSNWPTETHIPDEIGVIADLQCGGWSTTILSSEGKIYTVGVLDCLDGIMIGQTVEQFTQLHYRGENEVAIRSFSAGRRHVVALTDDGRILSWDRINSQGYRVYPKNSTDFGGKPVRVAAGWEKSSAYIPGVGIVFWSMVRNNQQHESHDGVVNDIVHVEEVIIPETARQGEDAERVDIVKHVVLESFIVWITSEAKFYAYEISSQTSFQVPGYVSEGRQIKDVQGQFNKFGVFTSDGKVLAGTTDYLRQCSQAIQRDPHILESGDWMTMTDLLASRPRDIPALQNTGVIALAYGDHHYQALHADGRITSYGTDSESCGSLGLGAIQTGAQFRGLKRSAVWLGDRDAKLLPVAEIRGRSIWFEPEKRDWLAALETQSTLPSFGVGVEVSRAAQFPNQPHDSQQAMFSEWIEQEGRHWDDGPSISSQHHQPSHTEKPLLNSKPADTYNHLSAYFGITIAAAGWHSGALVLVDDIKAEEVRQKWIHNPSSSAPATQTPPPDNGDQPSTNDTTSNSNATIFDHIMMPGRFIPQPQSFMQPKPVQRTQSTGEDQYIWDIEGVPRIELPDGSTIPGKGEVKPWRDGMPTLEDLGLVNQ